MLEARHDSGDSGVGREGVVEGEVSDVRRKGHVAEEEEDAIERAVDARDGDMSEVGGKWRMTERSRKMTESGTGSSSLGGLVRNLLASTWQVRGRQD